MSCDISITAICFLSGKNRAVMMHEYPMIRVVMEHCFAKVVGKITISEIPVYV
jgi:hypothetical protein